MHFLYTYEKEELHDDSWDSNSTVVLCREETEQLVPSLGPTIINGHHCTSAGGVDPSSMSELTVSSA